MNRWENFSAVCALLSGRPLNCSGWNWEEFVGFASAQYISPALADPIGALPDAPKDVKDYFATVAQLNALRVEEQLAALVAVVAKLQHHGIDPFVMKGAASLICGDYQPPESRFQHDLDLLVRPEEFALASKLFLDMGYYAKAPETPDPWIHKVYEQSFAKHQTGLDFDLHCEIDLPTLRAYLPVADFRSRATSKLFRGIRFQYFLPADRVAHCIVHAQLHHHLQRKNLVSLRQLYELSILIKNYKNVIDWNDLRSHFIRHRVVDVFDGQLEFCAAHFDQTTPIDDRIVRGFAKRVKTQMLSPPHSRQRRFYAVVANYFERVRQSPVLWLSFFQPNLWPRRIAKIKAALRK